jgi:hypothetical protein
VNGKEREALIVRVLQARSGGHFEAVRDQHLEKFHGDAQAIRAALAAYEEPPRDVEQAHRERVIDATDSTIEEAIALLRELSSSLLHFYNPDKGKPEHIGAVERVCADLTNTFLAAREDTERPDGEQTKVEVEMDDGLL